MASPFATTYSHTIILAVSQPRGINEKNKSPCVLLFTLQRHLTDQQTIHLPVSKALRDCSLLEPEAWKISQVLKKLYVN